MAVDFHKYKEAGTLNYEVADSQTESGDIGFDMDNSMLSGSMDERLKKAEKNVQSLSTLNMVYGLIEGVILKIGFGAAFGIIVGAADVITAFLLRRKNRFSRGYTIFVSILRMLMTIPIALGVLFPDDGPAELIDYIMVPIIFIPVVLIFIFSVLMLLFNKDIKELFSKK
ncbi:MAG: hypothetical protein J5999_06570 [Oscillospiraceae bacterium]|nr:hypothetical protein [Oscillospiraceae bacterium]